MRYPCSHQRRVWGFEQKPRLMRHTLITGILFLLLGCQTKEQQETIEAPGAMPVDMQADTITTAPEPTTLQHRIKGIWSNETSHDGVFEVTDTTFYYADNFVDYPYDLEGNRITIHYPDYTYEAEVSVVNDTLRMESEEQGVLVFWRFE